MDLEKINEILSDLSEYELKRKFKQVQNSESAGYYGEKNQGDEGEKTEVYDIGEENTFLKIVRTSDSYGSENGISLIRFCEAKTKEVQVYE